MNNAQMSARVGLFFLLGLGLIWVTFEAISNGGLQSKNGYELTANFTNLKELKADDQVRMAGVPVGVVKTTRLEGRMAVAVLMIDPKVTVANDSVATIAMAGLLGSNYVALSLGSATAPALEAGDRMKSRDTGDLNSLVTKLGDIGDRVDAALSEFSGVLGGKEGEGGLLSKVDALVEENRLKIGQITSNLNVITGRLEQGEGTLGKLINDPGAYNELVASLAEIRAAADEAKSFIKNAESIIDQVKSGQGTLGALLYDDQTASDIKIVAANLRELSTKLNTGQGTLGKLLSDDSLYLQAQGVINKVDRAVDGLADQGPITAVGTAANALF